MSTPAMTAPDMMAHAARDLARWLIRAYVRRGDPIAYLRQGGMSYSGKLGAVSIHLDHITVERIGPYDGGTPCSIRFRLADLYREIRREINAEWTRDLVQPSLFASVASEQEASS